MTGIQMVLCQLKHRRGGRTGQITVVAIRRARKGGRVASVDAAAAGHRTSPRSAAADGSGPRNVRCQVCGTDHATSVSGCISDHRKKAFAAKAVHDWSADRDCYTCGAIGHPMMDHPDHRDDRPNFEYQPWTRPSERGRGGSSDRGGGRSGYGSGFRGGARGGSSFRGGRGGLGFGNGSTDFGRGRK